MKRLRLVSSTVGLALALELSGAASGQAAAAPAAQAPASGPADFADVFQRVSPAVVSIVVTTHAPQAAADAENVPYPFNQLPQFQKRGDGAEREVQAAGSGFFITPDGYIVTNNHVVEGATKITVTLADKREFPGRVVGRDEATDLAVIKVDGQGFTPVAFETEVKPRVGDWVMAVGNPLQLGGTATAGIVSYVGRDLQTPDTTFLDYLQISAPITFGNSGGPTFDGYGRVVGVNTAIYSQGGSGGGGIGFAVPADTAAAITRQLMTGRSIQRGYLGATIQGLDRESDAALGLQPDTGAEIAEVTPGGPADRAGLRPGDIVVSIDGQPVGSSTALTRAVARTQVGGDIRLEVRRGGQPRLILVRAGLRPSEQALAARQAGPADAGADDGQNAPGVRPTDVLGLRVSALDAAARRAQGLAPDVVGVVIRAVAEGSDAERKGLRPGDVVVQADQQPVSSPEALAAVASRVRRAGRPAVFLLIQRDGRNIGLPVKLQPDPRS